MVQTTRKPDIRLKRAYERPSADDGTRILVDRLWPRGVRKADIAIEQWLKEVAPSTELRRWFGHDPGRWSEFRRRYERELSHNVEALRKLGEYVQKGRVTLVYAARDQEHNEAIVLRDFLVRHSSLRRSLAGRRTA
ncbi:MAG: DUF488 domain-containing protein [Proteobacteria bacterium]|nr:DUF488 domain-containing protein [Pseudomonadota bacterium]